MIIRPVFGSTDQFLYLDDYLANIVYYNNFTQAYPDILHRSFNTRLVLCITEF